MDQAGREQCRDDEPAPAAQEPGHGPHAEGEGQLPRMEVALQRVGAGLGDRVTQRQRREQRHGGQRRT